MAIGLVRREPNIRNNMRTIVRAIKRVIARPVYASAWWMLTLVFFGIFLMIPVWTVPGNDLAFQLEIYRARDFLLLSVLAILAALTIVMNVFVLRLQRNAARGAVGSSGLSGVGAMVAAVMAPASCVSCLSTIFGFLGFGTILTILSYRWIVVTISIALVLISLWLTARRMERACARTT